jgi:non-heme chloroperoxidase
MQAGLKGVYDCIKAFVPIGASAMLSSRIVKGAPHGLCSTHKDKVNADLLAFLQA